MIVPLLGMSTKLLWVLETLGILYKSEEHGCAVFDTMDKNKDGKIERDEFITTQLKFWYELED